MKGIITGGGLGSRLAPLTQAFSKHLLPVYNKPMIYYSLHLLLQTGARQIAITTNPSDAKLYQQIFGDGSRLGIKLEYILQPRDEGVVNAILAAETFIQREPFYLVLGDNFLFGPDVRPQLKATTDEGKTTIFTYEVSDPEHYGVVVLDNNGNAMRCVEKPTNFISPLAIIGCYYFDDNLIDITKKLLVNRQSELIVPDIINYYLERNALQVKTFSDQNTWYDLGAPDNLLAAANFVAEYEKTHPDKIACLEQFALYAQNG